MDKRQQPIIQKLKERLPKAIYEPLLEDISFFNDTHWQFLAALVDDNMSSEQMITWFDAAHDQLQQSSKRLNKIALDKERARQNILKERSTTLSNL